MSNIEPLVSNDNTIDSYSNSVISGEPEQLVGGVLLDAASWVRSSSEEGFFFFGRGDCSFDVKIGSDSIPSKLFRMRV